VGRAFGVALVACLLAAAPGHAQVSAPAAAAPAPAAAPPAVQPITGFVSSYEITRIARLAGFDPLAPPLREGTIYVLRATDYRGILMRVVIDARTGAIRDANRIVPGPGRYGQFYSAPPLYDPADLAEPVIVPSAADLEPPPLRPLLPHGRSALPEIPPLPRPRPAALASRKPQINSEMTTSAPPAAAAAAASAAPPAPATTSAAPAAPRKSPAIVEPLND
jgi:hypothetical protein